MYDKYGTSSIEKLKKIFGDRLQISEERFLKNKYIYIISHSKKEKQYIQNKLKVKSLPYPKGNISYYNTEHSNFNTK